jgi:transcription initiation factor TFIIA large subunit
MVPQHPHYPSMTTHSYSQPYVKAEPVDSRYNFNALPSYTIPPLPGPQLGTAKSKQSLPSGHQTVISFPSGPSAPGRPPAHSRDYSASQQDVKPPLESQQRIPQVDGPSSSSSESATPPPPSQPYAPRSLHPSLPPPLSQGSTSTAIDDEAINSDLDDSSTEGEDEAEEGAGGDTDIVFCTYDKVRSCFISVEVFIHHESQVARVKNKRKCILKDGMIHINGKDYLFAKCTGYVPHIRHVVLSVAQWFPASSSGRNQFSSKLFSWSGCLGYGPSAQTC